ncbi:hypothetical protein J8Z82_10025 [Yersinia enterocolitica]|uniref:hypothetical protein n=1 Tax=Yersinia enterocolitica TaxID=630 RepID=UPI001C8DFD56|nr:hypothetical protein [Yersinia enterocolitica]MBX9489504.1 hypothetical protein [Yersinia enterocolitica]MBX9492128.1 hypothetical protein [Yersinia enterocolitica]
MKKKLAKQGNVLVLGRSGSGKTVHCARVVQALLSEQQLNEWRKLRKDIQKNEKNTGDEHHDNQP